MQFTEREIKTALEVIAALEKHGVTILGCATEGVYEVIDTARESYQRTLSKKVTARFIAEVVSGAHE